MNARLQKKPRIQSSLAISSATQVQQLLQTVRQLNRLTAVLETQAKYDEALAQAQTALENLTKAKTYLSFTTTVTLELQVLANLGRLQRILGNYAQGQQFFLQAIHLAQTEAADKQILIPLSNELAMLYKYWGHFEAAEPIYQNLLTTLLARYGANHLAVAKVYHNLAGLEHARRCYEKAEPLARQSYQLHLQLLGKQHPDTIADGAALGAILHGLKQWDEAINLFEQAIAWFEQQFGSNHDLVAVNLNNLAASLQAKGELKQAERAYRQALSIQESLWKQEHPELAITLNNLAILLKQQGQFEEARSLFKRALTIFDKTLGVNHPHTILCQQNAA